MWFCNGEGPSPFKRGPPSPFLGIPGCDGARYMTLDFCHAFHLGYGIDMAASTVVLMASALNLYEGRSLDQRLHNAFRNFISWCKNNRRVTSVSDFSKLAFDMVSTLVFLWQHVLSLNHFGPGSQLYVKDRYVDRPFGVPFFPIGIVPDVTSKTPSLRNHSFPTSLGGKAYDTAVVLAWLQDEMLAMESASWLLIFWSFVFCMSPINGGDFQVFYACH